MKTNFKLLLILFLFINSAIAQTITIKSIESRLITNEGVEFVGELKDKSNDMYAFSDWNNPTVVSFEGEVYQLSNINFNITTNTFDSRISRDKHFVFKNSTIDYVKINNQTFKNIDNTFFEVLFEIGEVMLLKKHEVAFLDGIVNRLDGKRAKSKPYISYNYLYKSKDNYLKVELNKKGIFEIYQTDEEIKLINNFIKDNNLKFRKEQEFIELLILMTNKSNS